MSRKFCAFLAASISFSANSLSFFKKKEYAYARQPAKSAQAKYENGKATMTEFNESKNNYLKSESDLVQARYENLYQHALIEFYRGKELNF